MSYLLYCILNGHRGPARPTLRGVREQTVWVLDCDDLCAAVSQGAESSPAGHDPNSAPQLDDLLAYAKVVEAFHRRESVVP
ncbi:MAG TPA: GvpL/GvpF family gas vesicle protein [Candidatus Binataceae bacterium]|nr:GvpL/GvpF family gas vesicle protein [Candidatus Binataceae bacterium]